MTKSLFMISLALAFMLTACASTTQPAPMTTPSLSPLTSPPRTPQEISVTYRRSGGLAGTDDTWKISGDGQVVHQGQAAGTPQQLSGAQMTELTAAIRAANFMSLADSYVPQATCCDRYLYEITVTLNGQSKTVQTIDGSPTAPAELNQLVATLNRLVSTAN